MNQQRRSVIRLYPENNVIPVALILVIVTAFAIIINDNALAPLARAVILMSINLDINTQRRDIPVVHRPSDKILHRSVPVERVERVPERDEVVVHQQVILPVDSLEAVRPQLSRRHDECRA